MTKSTESTPLRRAVTFIRGCVVAFLMFPGSGLALFAAACGDLDDSAMVSVDAYSDALTPSTSVEPTSKVAQMPERVAPLEAEVEPSPTILPLNEPAPIVRASEPRIQAPAALAVVEATLAHGVSKRRPVRPATEFRVGDVAWAWISVKNSGEAQPATMIWYRDGEVRSRLTLDIGKSPRWRTWSRRTMRSSDVGSWQVEVHDQHGEIIHTLRFDVIETHETITQLEPSKDGC